MTAQTHAVVANLVAVPTGEGKRVLAVQWAQHDVLTCDGNHLELQTDGWLYCPASGCTWSFDPESRCPDHPGGVS